MPTVSIAIPVYNGALYLEECLKSAVNQTFADIEVVLVDDCSTDDTSLIAERFSGYDRRLRIFRNRTRLGMVENWNRCIRYCRGQWIKFLFQDDALREDCLERMLGAVGSTNSGATDNFVVGDRNFVIEKGVEAHLRDFYIHSVVTMKDIFPCNSRIFPQEFSEAILKRGVGLNFVGEPTSVMIRRKTCLEYSFFNQNLVHLCDLEYWTRIATNEICVYVPEKLSNFRVHNRSASAHNHTHRKFQLTYLDKIILLHDYLFHPFYENLRRVPHSEEILSHCMRGAVKDLGDFTAVSDRPEYMDLVRSLITRYPKLRREFEVPRPRPVSGR